MIHISYRLFHIVCVFSTHDSLELYLSSPVDYSTPYILSNYCYIRFICYVSHECQQVTLVLADIRINVHWTTFSYPRIRPRPVYRSEFVIKLQTMREQKRALAKTKSHVPRSRYNYLSHEDRIEWMPSIEPIIPEKLPRYTSGHSPVRVRTTTGTINNTETNIMNTRVSRALFKNSQSYEKAFTKLFLTNKCCDICASVQKRTPSLNEWLEIRNLHLTL